MGHIYFDYFLCFDSTWVHFKEEFSFLILRRDYPVKKQRLEELETISNLKLKIVVLFCFFMWPFEGRLHINLIQPMCLMRKLLFASLIFTFCMMST